MSGLIFFLSVAVPASIIYFMIRRVAKAKEAASSINVPWGW